MKLKKGDKIKVMVGRDKGKEGVIDRVYGKQSKVLVLGANIYKKHVKKSDKMPQGGVVEVPRPLSTSKVRLICPKCGKQARIGYRITKNKKLRVCKKCDQQI